MAKNKASDALSIVHPGFIIRMELNARGIRQKDFAEQIAIQPSHLSEILKGTRNISNPMADAMGQALGIPSAHIKHLQAEYDFKKKAAMIADIEEHEAEKMLSEYHFIYDMKVIFKYVGIADKRSTEKLKFCKESLRFSTPKQQERVHYGFYHKSESTGLDSRMIATWSVLAQYEAERQPKPIGIYSKGKLDDLSNELATIFNENNNTINRVSRSLSNYGIKFCVVPKVERASIDGYSFISDGQPSIVVTQRYNKIDNIAFAILHEVGHLKLHMEGDGERVNIADADHFATREEREANDYAAKVLIPDNIWQSAPEVPLNPHAIQLKYTAWAKQMRLNKWIVLGRISHDTGMYMFKSDNSREIK